MSKVENPSIWSIFQYSILNAVLAFQAALRVSTQPSFECSLKSKRRVQFSTRHYKTETHIVLSKQKENTNFSLNFRLTLNVPSVLNHAYS